MRNKLKKIWNKEDGFTLVELLGVIVILGIILAIAIPGIGTIIDRAETNTEKNQAQLVLDAAKMYQLNEEDGIPTEGVTDTVLSTAGYLDKDLNGVYLVKVSVDETTNKETYTITGPGAEGIVTPTP